tara:strand:- start:3011 stop:3655 length:645 start_codon:yes stop_codon:yes gene_type:complete
MRVFAVMIFALFSSSVLSQTNDDLGDRVNVMECSENEVMAYVSKPNKTRDVRSYQKYKPANIQTLTEEQRSTNNPAQCAALLYEDLGQMKEQMENAVALMTSGINPNESLMSQVWDYVSGSVCERVDAGLNTARDEIVSSIKSLEKALLNEVDDVVGQKAFEGYINDYLEDNTSETLGLGLGEGGGVMPLDLQRNLKSKWKRRLRELDRELPGN